MATIKKKRAASAAKEYFSKIPQISYEGPTSKNPWAFKWYNPEELVEGKTMAEHLRFSVVYWHTFRGTGADPFGMGTMLRPWDDGTDSIENAQKRIRVAVPNVMGYDDAKFPKATYHAFWDETKGYAAPTDGRPVFSGLRPEFTWPAGAIWSVPIACRR